jgi:transposase
MSGKSKNPKVKPIIKQTLSEYATSRTFSSSLVNRSKIVLLSLEGVSNREIAKVVGLHYNNVATWKKRFKEALPMLEALVLIEESKEKPNYSDLEKELKQVLADKPRPGTPSTITAEQVLKIMNLACQSPQDHGYEVSHWTHVLLAEAAVKIGMIDEISRSSIGRFLKDSRYTSS